MNFSVSNTDHPPLEERCVWTVKEEIDQTVRKDYILILWGFLLARAFKRFCVRFLSLESFTQSFIMSWSEGFLSASGEVLTKLCRQCPWDSLIRHHLGVQNFQKIRLQFAYRMAQCQPTTKRKGGRGASICWDAGQYIWFQESKINIAVSQVEVPFAEGQVSFLGQGKYEAQEPVWESLP